MRTKCLALALMLALSLGGSVWAADTTWTGATGDALWTTAGNWSNGLPPAAPTVIGNINIPYVAAYPVVNIDTGTTITCGSGSYTTDLHGPNFGMTLNIDGGSLTHNGFVMAAVANNASYTSTINVMNGGSLSVKNLCLGDTWWYTAPYVTLNVYDNSTVNASDYIWLGGHINIYGGSVTATNGFNMAVNTATYAAGTTVVDIYGGKLVLPSSYSDSVETWISSGYLKAYGTTPGQLGAGSILVDTTTLSGSVILSAIPSSTAYDPQVTPANTDGSVGTLISGTEVQVTLNWQAGLDPNTASGNPFDPNIVTHYVYSGTSEDSLTLLATVPQPSTTDASVSYGPVTLPQATTYYWSVEEGMLNSSTGQAYPTGDPNNISGPIWSFTTKAATPEILTDPANVIASPDASFTVTASDTATSFQWYKVGSPDVMLSDAAPYSGTTTPTLLVANATLAEEGQYYCVAYNGEKVSEPSAAAYLWTQRLMGHWKFDGTLSDSVTDTVAGAATHDGAIAGTGTGMASYGSGQNGSAIQFANTGDYVAIDDPGFFNFYPLGFTTSFWYKETSAVGWRLPVSKLDAGTSGWMFGVDNAYRNQAVFIFEASNDAAYWADGNIDIVVGDGNWHMITATYNPADSTLTMYTDGDENESVVIDLTDETLPAAALSIGGRDTESSIDGSIDDVRIYSFPMTPLAIAQLYVDFEPAKWVCVEDPANPLNGFDFDGDCRISLSDFAEFAAMWLECQRYPESACD